MTGPRVRFAPSPTGYLHVGSARTALFNWLYARANGGTLVLRMEDTDDERNRPELLQLILDELGWLGIDIDEGPYYQSERRDRHREAVEQLLAEGKAYLCDADNDPVAGDELVDGLAVRFRVPDDGATVIHDLVRGEVRFDHSELEDFVLWRSNGTAVFLLANGVDDADMGITHAIRGEDLLNGAPKVTLILGALGLEPPAYAHLPLLVNEQRKKLSKRVDDVALDSYRDRGYLPEAMANYLALLGWGPRDDIEIRPMREIVERFDLADISKAPAFFDLKKLDHFNGTYIRELSLDEFTERAQPWLTGEHAAWPADRYDADVFAALAPILHEKIRTLGDIPPQIDWLFLPEPPIDEASWEKTMVNGPAATQILAGVRAGLDDVTWESQALYDLVSSVGETNELKLGKAQAPVRVAVTGRTAGPPLFDSLVLLERAEVIRRVEAAQARLA